jgi:glutamate synthase (NADPH/NADH) small chain
LYIDERGKIAVDAEGRTTLHGVWAAGDCASRSPDLTVHAVADAKVVVRSILHSFKGDQHAA